MTSSKLKLKIQSRSGGVVRLSSYKCGGFEGYASLVVDKKRRDVVAVGARTRAQAIKAALVKLAKELGYLDLVTECENDNQRYNDADFAARTL